MKTLLFLVKDFETMECSGREPRQRSLASHSVSSLGIKAVTPSLGSRPKAEDIESRMPQTLGDGTCESEIQCVKRILKLIMLKSGTVLGVLDDILVSC